MVSLLSIVDATTGNPSISLIGTGAFASTHTAALSWNTSGSVLGYNVYRSTTSGTGYQKLSFTTNTSFNDSTIAGGKTYYYVVTAVAANGAESSYSTQAVAIIP